MFYYTVQSSHWPMNLEFRSDISLNVGQCFRILRHDGLRPYHTRFKVLSVSENPTFKGQVVTIESVDLNVESF